MNDAVVSLGAQGGGRLRIRSDRDSDSACGTLATYGTSAPTDLHRGGGGGVARHIPLQHHLLLLHVQRADGGGGQLQGACGPDGNVAGVEAHCMEPKQRQQSR